MDLNVDLARERSTEHQQALRRRRRGLTLLMTFVAVLLCLSLGIGLGWLAGRGGDTGATQSAGESTPPPVRRGDATVGARGGVVTQTEAQRSVERRLAGVALEQAAVLVARAVTAGRTGEVPPRAAGAERPGAERVAPNGPPASTAGEPAVVLPGDASSGVATPATPVPTVTEAAAPRESAAGHATRGARERRSGEVTPDRWRDPNVQPVDYDFSVPFEQRRERSQRELLQIDQQDPY